MNTLLLMIGTALIAWLAHLIGKWKSKPVLITEQHLESKLASQESEHKIQIKQAQEALLSSERRYSTLAKIAPVGIFHTSATGDCLYVNERWCEIAGITPQEALGQGWTAAIHPEDRSRVFNEWYRSATLNLPFKAEYRFQRPDKRKTWVLGLAMAEIDESGSVKGYVGTITDISDHKQTEIKLQHDALHDSLTDLPNRALLMEQLKHSLKRQQRNPDKLLGILFLDLDRFKVINDSLGHLVGDQLLIALAHRLEQCKRDSDTVARLGGDEFVILLEELTDSESAIKVAERIHQALEKPFILKNQELFISASIGIALSSSPNYYSEPTQLLRDADTAMYKAKERGKSCHAVFDPSMHTHALWLLQIENDLRRAISRQELVIYYQPIVSLETNCLEGVEALVRWQHPEHGLVSPADFIPMAEETGIIIALDQWVLKNACCLLRYWQQQFPAFSHLTLSVNLSGHHFFQMDFLEQIDQIIASTGISGQYLKLEITESVLLSNPDSTAEMLKQLKKRNIQVCLDDFGTGYSSLSYLHHFPLNILKIDRSFVSTLEAQDSRTAIVRTIVTLGHELGIEVIAEGIETAYQMQFLKGLDCHYGQGYCFSPPVDSKTMTTLLTSSNPIPLA